MINKVYLIDLPMSDTKFIKDVCTEVSSKVFGEDTETVFDSLNAKFAKTNIKMNIDKSSTFMYVISESVSVLVKEYEGRENIFVYKDSDSFMKEVMSKYGVANITSSMSTESPIVEEVKSVNLPEEVEEVKSVNFPKELERVEETTKEGVTQIDLGVDEQNVDFYKAQINTLRSEKGLLLDELEELKTRLERDTAESNSSNMVDLVICQNELSDAKKKIETLEVDIRSSKKVLESTVRERDNFKTEATNAKELYKKANTELGSLVERVKSLVEERDNLKVECSEEKKKAIKLEEDYTEIVTSKDTEISKLNIDNTNLKTSLDVKTHELEKSEQERNKYLKDYMDIKTELDTNKQELDNALTDKKLTESEKDILKEKLSESTETNKALIDRIEEYKTSSENDKKELEENKSECEKYKLLYENERGKLEVKEKENIELSAEISRLKEDLSANLSTRDKEISEITEKNNEISRLKKEIDDLNEKFVLFGNKSIELDKKEAEISKLNSEISLLKTQLSTKDTGVLSDLTISVGVKSKIGSCLLNSSATEYNSNLFTVFSANSDSIVDSCRHIFNKVKMDTKECLVIDFNYDTFLDSLIGIEKNKNVKNFHGYIDGLVEYEDCVYKTKFDNVRYMRLAKGFINENYLATMNWDRFYKFIGKYNGNIYLNLGVLSSSIKLLVYNTLCKIGNTELVSKTTPVNLRSMLCLLSTLTEDTNLTCVCVAPKNGEVHSMVRKINKKYVIVDEDSIEIKK